MSIFKPNVKRLEKRKDVEGLLKILNQSDRDRDKQWKTIEALGRIGDPAAVKALSEAVKSDFYQMRENAAKALGEIGSAMVVEPLLQLLLDESMHVRETAKRSLLKIKDPRAIEPLINALKHKNVQIYGPAARIIRKAKIWDSKALDKLEQELKDKNPLVRAVSADVLLAYGREQKVPSTHKAQHLLAKKNWTVDEMVELGKAAVKPLIQLLKGKNTVEPKVIASLGCIGSSQAVRPLIELLKKERSNYKAGFIVEALGKIGDPKAIELLSKALKSDHWHLGESAAKALGQIKDPRVNEILINSLSKYNRSICVNILGRRGDLNAAEPILDFLFRPRALRGGSTTETTLYYQGWDLYNLFKDYSELIIRASQGFKSVLNYSTNIYTWDVDTSSKAVEELCGIRTAISDNILHKVVNRNEIKVVSWQVHSETHTIVLNLDQQKNMAKKELEIRGNPAYNPSVYLEKKAWKLHR